MCKDLIGCEHDRACNIVKALGSKIEFYESQLEAVELERNDYIEILESHGYNIPREIRRLKQGR